MKTNFAGICCSLMIFLLGNIGQIHAQTVYLDSLFTSIEKTTRTYFAKPGEELKLDLFDPIENQDKDRPVILYVHGGGFSGGERDHPVHEDFLRHFAYKGYVTATMSYTLQRKGKSFGCNVDAGLKIETFLETARDINRAAAFLIKNKDELSINPSKIIVAGSSAGAEAALHAVYWDITKRDSTGAILSENFRYAGVISMAGAVSNINHIKKNSAIPTQLFHGTDDELVPYGVASHHYCSADTPGFLMLFGAQPISEQLQDSDAGYYLVTGVGGRHKWASKPLSEYRTEISDFLFQDVLLEKRRQIHVKVQSSD